MKTEVITQSSDRYAQQNKILFDLAVTQRKNPVGFLDHINIILKTSAEFLNVQRMSVWEFRKGRTILECLSLYQLESDFFSNDLILLAKDYPSYFKACKEERIIAAEDACKDSRTSEFANNYLPQFGITSMLDAPIFLGADEKGILCIEHVGAKRKWLEADQSFAASLADIIALSLAERDKNEARELIVSGFHTVPQGVLICDEEGRLIRANKKAAKIFGYTEIELYYNNVNDLIPGCMTTDEGGISGVISGIHSPDHLIENQVAINRSGERFPIEYSSARLSHWRGPCALIIFSDISERREKEELLQRNELLYRTVVEDMTHFIIRVAPGGRLRFANASTCNYFELDPDNFSQYNVFDVVPDSEVKKIKAELAAVNIDNPVVSYSHKVFMPGGEVGKVAWTLRAFYQGDVLMGWQGIGKDIAEQERRELRERNSQRLESLAVLAGGMAHDFNNLLTPILCYSDMTQVMLPPGSEEKKNLEKVMQAASRARELTRMVLLFSKHETTGERLPVFAVSYIKEIIKFIKSTSSARIKFHENVDADCGVIKANPSDLYQILSNLCTNATQAMPAGGELTITSCLIQRHEQKQLQIEVKDTGAGIAEEKISFIYDPFFSTKPAGEGTGLGLSVVKSIIDQLGGEIDCHSEAGEGTSFVIYLPTQVSKAEHGTLGYTDSVLEGSETVLVVDDELPVATSIRDVLEKLGYKVIMRTSASEALTVFNEDPDRIDILVTDYTMPYMSGLELSWNFHRMRPNLPVIMMSGYETVLTDDEVASAGLTAVIEKPFITEEISTLLRVVLKNNSG